ncbi:LIP-domain-containing protein [Myriangium duriaei CBS 260.36]|uniref:LIP-domain-containing protein n=1 Tax=Myriangium duriaei CBS 260.36 TaxID=1168546 RepID=A0A9P4J4F5_9PEZI|nr:LIP-domain-containing protein [Myriangium duriaei CBS 260.36]
MWILPILPFAILAPFLTTAVVGTEFIARDTGILRKFPFPSQDSFYSPPAKLETFVPGTVLRTRQINASFFGFVPRRVLAWQLLYRSNAVDGSAIAAVTTIFQPSQPKRDRFVSYQAAYNSACPDCVPSFAWRLGSWPGRSPLDHLEPTIEFLRIQGYLLQGYIVSSPDHAGPDGAFTVGRVSARCVLDGMRAATNFGRTQGLFNTTPAIVGVGYSGGGIPTSWASTLQRQYAPELPVKGWVFGGAPVNWTEVILTMDKSKLAGLVFTGIVGLLSPTAYQTQLGPLWEKIVTFEGRQMFRYVRSHCLENVAIKYRHDSMLTNKYQTLGPDFLTHPISQKVLTDNFLGFKSDEIPIAPVLLWHGTKDQMVPVSQASSLANSWCNRKVSVTFNTYNAEHMTASMLGIPKAYRFVEKAFAGSVRVSCSNQNDRSDNLNFAALPAKLMPLLTNLTTYLEPARRWDRAHPR